MITPTALLGALRRAEEVLHRLGVSSASALQQCIDCVVNKKPHPPPTVTIIVFVPNIILVEEKKVEDVYCASGEDRIQAQLREAEGAKTLLLEVIRRAAYDWVLYKDSSRPEQRQLAEEAHTWLFEEQEGHPDFELRRVERREFTSFLAICEALDMDADRVRFYIRKLTPNRVVSGRQPSRSRSAPVKKTKSRCVDYDDLILSLMDKK